MARRPLRSRPATYRIDALATDIFSAAEDAHRKSRLRSLRDLDAAAIVLRDVSLRVVQDDEERTAQYVCAVQHDG